MTGSTVTRFWAKVDKDGPNGCWVWTASTSDGYGAFWDGKRVLRAHRFAYELLVEAIPRDKVVDHLCRNRACVNPMHMQPVPLVVNMLRGESPRAKKARQTHCLNGHPYDEENTYREKKHHWRMCRACHREREARRAAAKRAIA